MNIAPWNLGRVMACPGSPSIECQYPDTGKQEAGEGKLAHMVSGAILTGREPETIDNIDPDMMAHVMSYVRHCQAIAWFGDLHVEERFAGHYFNGILDFWSFNPNDETLYIRDLKYGFGWVEVFENWQLLAYAILIMMQGAPAVKKINLGICQPRPNHPQGPNRSWIITIDELRAYEAQMNATLADVYAGNVQTVSGPHCRYCKGIIRCHGVEAAAAFAIDVAMTPGHQEPTSDQIATDLIVLDRALKLLANKKAALDQQAVELIRKGTIISGWEVGQDTGKAKWRHAADTVIQTGAMMEVNLAQDPTPITPTQALSRKLITQESFDAMSERTPGAWKLRKVNTNKIKELLK